MKGIFFSNLVSVKRLEAGPVPSVLLAWSHYWPGVYSILNPPLCPACYGTYFLNSLDYTECDAVICLAFVSYCQAASSACIPSYCSALYHFSNSALSHLRILRII